MPGHDGNQLDAMFFPCTQKEEVIMFKDGKPVNDGNTGVNTSMSSVDEEQLNHSVNGSGQTNKPMP